MRVQSMGEGAKLVTLADGMSESAIAAGAAAAAHLSAHRPPGVDEVVPAYGRVCVSYQAGAVADWAASGPSAAIEEWVRTTLTGEDPQVSAKREEPRDITIPVCYSSVEGPDLEASAQQLGISVEELVTRHTAAAYRVGAVGFAPGFAYLTGLPDDLRLQRLAEPRVRVEPGSVGIGVGQAGVYPSALPGGWRIIGRTNLRLFDPGQARPSLLAVGDRVRFEATDQLSEPPADPLDPVSHEREAAPAAEDAVVIEAGMQTTIQDLGRRGWAAAGVGIGGAVDPWSAMLANLAVGNRPNTPVLETTLAGPVLHFRKQTRVAVAGAECVGWPSARAVAIAKDETADFSRMASGARCYVAVAGGWSVRPVLGSAATHLGAGFGGMKGRALRAGDLLAIDPPPSMAGSIPSWAPARGFTHRPTAQPIILHFVPGIDWPQSTRDAASYRRALEASAFRVSSRSNRMGVRLDGRLPEPPGPVPDESRPVVPGTVQVPPGGSPIVLLAEGQTIGGYPQVGQVAFVDQALLAQCVPGQEVRLRVISEAEAADAWIAQVKRFRMLECGIQLRCLP